MLTKLRLVFSITILFVSFYGVAQSGYWQEDNTLQNAEGNVLQNLSREKTKLFTLDENKLVNALARNEASNSETLVAFPDAHGGINNFLVKETSILSPELAAKYPGITSYTGYNIANSKEKIRFSVSHKGIQSMIFHANGAANTFMQKASKKGNQYMVYNAAAHTVKDQNFICDTQKKITAETANTTTKLVDDRVLRVYRLAVSATGEYTQYHGGTVADALAAINATLTRVNGVFETDLGVRVELIANTDTVIYTDPATDPYNTNSLNSLVQQTLTTRIGEGNYDIGHLFTQGSDNGDAGAIGGVCLNNVKGSAFTSGRVPEGDRFDIDFVAHEMGHQLGANHTWSFRPETGLVQAEPASGTTIMGYAGIQAGQNVQSQGNDYFHYYSIFQIQEVIKNRSCGSAIPIDNMAPVIVPGADHTIPIGTAFVLTANASDENTQDVLTYAWEQIDNGVVTTASFGPNNLSGANFRSVPPTTSPKRYFPRLSRVATGNLTQTEPATGSAWETVSNVSRELNFALTVRDNVAGAGQVASDLIKIDVTDVAGPFLVRSQTNSETYVAGTTTTVRWDVANTDKFPIDTRFVDIYLSTDGGLTFPELIIANVPNDGEQEILVPGGDTTEGRFMVKARDNVFFAINDTNFSITPSEIVLNFLRLAPKACLPN